MNTVTKKALFIQKCFRDIADSDYIAARSNYRLALWDQFLWNSLQCIEKYLKAILLYFDKSTKQINHNLCKALSMVESIPDIEWNFTNYREFIDYLTRFGQDRYFIKPKGTTGKELQKLDETVWNIRKYCQDLRFLASNMPDFNEYMIFINSLDCKKKSNKFRLFQPGYLESVLDSDRYKNQRIILVWKNLWFGSYKKHTIKRRRHAHGKLPPHYVFTDLYPWIKKHVYLTNEVKNHFESKKNNAENAEHFSGRIDFKKKK